MYLSILRLALEALFRMAVRAIWEGGNSSPASVMAACVRKSSALFLSDSGFSSVGYLVWGMTFMKKGNNSMRQDKSSEYMSTQVNIQSSPGVHLPWGQWAGPPWVCRGCGPPGESWVVGWAAAHTPGSAPEPSPALLGSPAQGCPQTGCWTRWTHPLYRTGMHTSAWNRMVSLREVI